MKINPLKQLQALGQSIWLDYIKRDLITSGNLKKLIMEDGLRGMTSNPALFEQALAESNEYKIDIDKLSHGCDANHLYEKLTQKDVRDAANEFRNLYNQSKGYDGYVSLEVNPHLAYDTQGTVEEARRLWKELNSPNVFIKVPATKEGLPAITQLISEGININVTLLFGLSRYREVAEAYIAGIEARITQGKPVGAVASVASFFLSRIDELVDPTFEKHIAENTEQSIIAKQLRGQIAIASAKIAYQIYQEIFTGDRFNKLAEHGAQTQRLLWASTGTKNPEYSDIKYVEALIGPETVNTLPLKTLDSYRDHGNPELRLGLDLDYASWAFQQLPVFGINMDKVTQQLEKEGVAKFNKAYDQLIETLRRSVK